MSMRPTLSAAISGYSSTTHSLQVWYVDLDLGSHVAAELRACLSDDELAKAERFRFEIHRNRYVIARAGLRLVLSRYLDCSARALRFSYGAYGKPYLIAPSHPVQFNLSHSDNDAVIVISPDRTVGVDIETIRPIRDISAISRAVFSEIERRELTCATSPVRAFLNGWTRKESYIKAIGVGCAASLTDISVSLSDTPAALLSTGDRYESAAEWNLLNPRHPRGIVAVALGPPRHSLSM